MTYREQYRLEFSWGIDSADYSVEARIEAARTHSGTIVGDASSYFLAAIIGFCHRQGQLKQLLNDTEFAIRAAADAVSVQVEDAYSMEDGTYVGITTQGLDFGFGADASDPENYSIPLNDFRALLLEFQAFAANRFGLLQLPFYDVLRSLGGQILVGFGLR